MISPLLANRLHEPLPRHWRQQGRGEAFRAHVVNYADDFVILSRGHADEALAWTRQVMTRLGLALNEAKTTVRDARQERFDFLGYSVRAASLSGRTATGIWERAHRRRACNASRQSVGEILASCNLAPWAEVRSRLNQLLRGWAHTSATARD